MPQIEGGRWDGTLRRLLGISDYGPAPGISSEVIATLEVQQFEPDMYGLANELLVGGRIGIGAVAGEDSYARVQNPANSGKILTLNRIEALRGGATAASYELRFTTTNPTTVNGTVNYLDRRLVGPTGAGIDFPAGQLQGFTSAVPVGTLWKSVQVVANDMWEYVPSNGSNVVLGPGDNVNIRLVVVNVGLTVSVEWRERAANQGELRLFSR